MNRRMSVSGSGAATWRHSSGSAGGTPMPGMVASPARTSSPAASSSGPCSRMSDSSSSQSMPAGSSGSSPSGRRFSQWSMRSLSRIAAQPTPHSRTAKPMSGKRVGTPPMKSDFTRPCMRCANDPDVVEAVVGHRGEAAGRHVAEPAVERHREAERTGFGPHRVVVVGAVETEGVEPVALLGHEEGRAGLGLGDRSGHPFGEADHLEAEVGAVPQPGQRLLRGVHGHHPRRGHPVGEGPVGGRVELVEATADPDAQLVVRDARDPEALRRIEDRVVEAELVHAVVHELRRRRGGEVAGVAGRRAPPRALRGAGGEAAVVVRVHDPVERARLAPVALVGGAPEGFPQVRLHRRQVLEHVPVGVDDRVLQASTDVLRAGHEAKLTNTCQPTIGPSRLRSASGASTMPEPDAEGRPTEEVAMDGHDARCRRRRAGRGAGRTGDGDRRGPVERRRRGCLRAPQPDDRRGPGDGAAGRSRRRGRRGAGGARRAAGVAGHAAARAHGRAPPAGRPAHRAARRGGRDQRARQRDADQRDGLGRLRGALRALLRGLGRQAGGRGRAGARRRRVRLRACPSPTAWSAPSSRGTAP